MEESVTKQEDKKKQSQGNYKFLMILGVLLIFVFLAVLLFISKANFQTKSDKVILAAAAKSINKDPNNFKRSDYTKVTGLDLSEKELSDISYVGKFKNMKTLKLGDLIIPEIETPKWKTALQKLHIIKSKPQATMFLFRNINFTRTKQITSLQDMTKENLVDLSPLKKLNKLEYLSLSNSLDLKNIMRVTSGLVSVSIRNGKTYTNPQIEINPLTFVDTIPFKNINPISSLTNLKSLSLDNTLISDITSVKDLKNLENLNLNETEVNDLEPIRNLTSLKSLSFGNTPVSDISPIKNLKNLVYIGLDHTEVKDLEPLKNLYKLKSLFLAVTKIESLEPLRGLTKLTQLEIDRTKVSDLEPIMGLKNIKELWMYQCENITDEQVEDLQLAHPNLKIYRHLNSEN